MGEIMGKHEEVDYIKYGMESMLRTRSETADPLDAIAEYVYHREIGWKKIIQCLLWLRDIGVAEIHLEDMSLASGKIEIRNYDGGKLVVGAGRPVDKATR